MTRAELQSIYHDFAERYGPALARRVVRWRGYSGSANLNTVQLGNFDSLARAFADVAAGRDRLPAYTPADDRPRARRACRTFSRKSVAPWL
ncbi:hypothetical protein [Bradyrhizobium sp. LVM 105]|uniref:hypothetical protein n=1 Tax=Bradyrhizobium sp. LVM 105 TaxID=2341115 RepID=UPI000F803D16|nr:hypothetical protein [Bradyrhizobium sp. LVM 105]